VLIMGRGGRDLARAVAVAEVPGAFAEPARGGATFELDRMVVRLHVGEAAADMLAELVNGLVLKNRPGRSQRCIRPSTRHSWPVAASRTAR
jgi:hypothetical protein